MAKKSKSKATKIINYARSPTLETVQSVEKFIEKHSGKYNRTKLWRKLPKGIMWQTYIVILNYLKELKKIEIDSSENPIFKIIKKETIEEKIIEEQLKQEQSPKPLPSYVE